jgi:hypothetical protein
MDKVDPEVLKKAAKIERVRNCDELMWCNLMYTCRIYYRNKMIIVTWLKREVKDK